MTAKGSLIFACAVKGLNQRENLISVPARWPEPNAGVARHVGGSHAYAEAPADRHIWLLIFWFFCIKYTSICKLPTRQSNL